MTITPDFETRSHANLRKVGVVPYAQHPTTGVICLCYGIDNEPIQSWWPGKYATDDCPTDLQKAIERGDEFEAHHTDFEWAIWTFIMMERYGWPAIPEEQYRDTMAVASYYALPASLDRLAKALGFEGKDPEGERLITKYSKLYLKAAKAEIPPEDFAKFVRYCEHDVGVEQSVSDALGDLPDRELPIYLLHRRTNQRGLYLDIAGIEAAAKIIDQASERLTREFRDLTGINPTQRDKCIEWFAGQGVKLENMQAEYLEDVIETLPQGPARTALGLRVRVNKASTTKLGAMARQRSRNGRALCQTRYHGAMTGRTTGGGFQPLNLSRGYEKMDPEQLIRDIEYGDAAWLDAVYPGGAMEAVGKASRYFIQAEPGNEIVAGDFVSIEAVLLACLAREQWKVDAFRNKVKIYEHMADKIYGLAPGTVTAATHPAERQDGKTCLGASTQVLTSRGWQCIVDVQLDDRVWDGSEWVKHSGLLLQGQRETINLWGIEITPDHLILSQSAWLDAQTVASDAQLKLRVREKGLENLPLRVLSWGQRVAYWRSGLAARVVRESIWLRNKICAKVAQHAAQTAQELLRRSGAKTFGGSQIFARMMRTVADYLTAFLPAFRVAGQMAMLTTGGAVSWSINRGARVRRESASTSRIFSPSPAGIIQRWKLTASKWIADTNRVIYGFGLAGKGRSDKFKISKPASMNLKHVYDLANAGPRRRFTVRCNGGALIVHNCELAFGYQGALNAWLKFDDSGRHSDERIIEICKSWRAEHPAIVAFWAGLGDAALDAVRYPGKEFVFRDIGFEIVDQWLSMILLNGKRLWYFKPEVRMMMPQWHQPAQKEECASGDCKCRPRPTLTYLSPKGNTFNRVHTYGGKLTENLTQATSREVLAAAAARLDKLGWPAPILTVYDELVYETPKGFTGQHEIEEIMAECPGDWARDWPITVEAWVGERYKKG